MTVEHYQFELVTDAGKITYKNITEKIVRLVEDESKVSDGIVVLSSPHTTCSVIFEEFVHDKDWNGDEYLQVDMNRTLNRMVPRQYTETDYLYPGLEHVAFLKEISQKDSNYPDDLTTILNADAHIKASLFGSSETFVLKNREMMIGSVGSIYFIDWDQNRERKRKLNIIIIGE